MYIKSKWLHIFQALNMALKLNLLTCCETVDLWVLERLAWEKLGITCTAEIGKMWHWYINSGVETPYKEL